MGKSCRVRQGGRRRVPCCRGGFILDDNHRDLGSLCRSLGQSPEKEWVRSKANQIQDKTARIEELQVQQRILLFFFLVGTERGEIEVRLASGATRRRSRFPCPLSRSSSMDREDPAPVAAAARGAPAATVLAAVERVARHGGC